MYMNNKMVDDYKIDKNDEIYYKDKPDLEIEIVSVNPYQTYDEYCDKMNRIKYELLEKTVIAGMGRIVVSTTKKPIIGTQALDTCYGILFYDRAKKEGICGHAVPSQLTLVMAEMMKWLKGRSGVIEYMILPGFRNVDRKDFSGLNELQNYMMKKKPYGIELKAIESRRSGFRIHQDTLSYEFAFDTINGEFVTEYVFFDSIEHNPRYIGPKTRV